MLEWTVQQTMQIEAEAKVGAEKGEHAKVREALRNRLDKMRTIFIISA